MIRAGVASALFLSSAGFGHADQYDDMQAFIDDLNTPEYISIDNMNDADFLTFIPVPVVGGGSIIHEARIDYNLGLLCEWDLFIKEGENQIQNVQCLEDGDDEPEWFQSYLETSSKKIWLQPMFPPEPTTDFNRLGQIFESSAVRDGFDDRYYTVKTWDISKSEVCIKIGRDFDVMNDDVLTVDLGCHPILNKDYRDQLMRYVGITPI